MDRQERYKNIITLIFTFIILAINTAIWRYVWMHDFAVDILRPFGYKGNWLVVVVYAVILLFITRFYGGYKVGYYLLGDVILSSVLSLIITNVLTYFQSSLIGRGLLKVAPFALMTVFQIFAIVIWSLITNKFFLTQFPPYKMLLVYGGDKMARSLVRKMVARDERYQIKEVINFSEGIDNIIDKMDGFHSVVLCDLPPKERNILMKYCFTNTKRVYLTPKISEIIVRGAETVNLFDTPLILSKNQGINLEQLFLKRAFDIVASVIGIIIASPMLLLAAIAIKVEDGGPILFKQARCTINNRVFNVVKFRSMIINAEKDGKPLPAAKNDNRITRVGKLIRAVRIDELPQLFNVLRGEMSLVGPRPERVEHVEKYTKEIPEFSMRAKVKAGLTGYAQIYGKYNTTAYDKLKLDLTYITTYSFVNDIKILFMTVKIIFVKSSTDGFEE